MVVLPYNDSLLLFSRYLQYLVMESPGKEFDLDAIFNNYETVCTISLQHLLKYCVIGPLVMIGSLNLELLLVTTCLECYRLVLLVIF
uniref:Putative ovule protein n=1 Tax=Solanum chacoense TaxID=4108 RepID=A0A0V0GY16_SOLCH